MRQNCIFCTTPFQIMTAVHLVMTIEKESVSDLYVVDQFARSDEVASRISETGIFRKVVLVHENDVIDKSNQSKLIIWSKIAKSYLQLNTVAKKILKDNYKVNYDAMYMSSKAFISRVVAMYYAKNEYNAEMIYFDDGLGSYFNRDLIYPRASDQLLRRILLGKNSLKVVPQKMMLYAPELLEKVGVININDVKVEALPKWEQTDEFKNILNNIFSYSQMDNIEEPVIIFDGIYTGEKRQMMDSFYKKVVDSVGGKNVIIKKHPRDKSPETEGLRYYSRLDLPFELLCLNNKMDGKLLIALSTTAVITPVLLFKEEPYVLILNNIKEMAVEPSEIHFDDFRVMYNNKDRFYEAESESDALEFVKRYCEHDILK